MGYNELKFKNMNTLSNKSTIIDNSNSIKESLLAAGKLAIAAKMVTTANAHNLSQRLEQMQAALNDYDNIIIGIVLSSEFVKKQTNCQCNPDDTTGATSVMCCNNCGKPTEDFWVKPTS